MKLSATVHSGFLTKTEEAKKSGSLRKRKPRSTPSCSLVGGNQLLVGENVWVEDVGADDPAGLAQGFLLDLLLVDAHGGHNLPLLSHRTGIFAWTPLTRILRKSRPVTVDLQPRRPAFSSRSTAA